MKRFLKPLAVPFAAAAALALTPLSAFGSDGVVFSFSRYYLTFFQVGQANSQVQFAGQYNPDYSAPVGFTSLSNTEWLLTTPTGAHTIDWLGKVVSRPFPLTGGDVAQGLARDPSSEKLYASTPNGFYQIDTSTLEVSAVLTTPPVPMTGLAAWEGTVYGVSTVDSNLYKYETQTQLWSVVGNHGLTLNDAGLAYIGSRAKLWLNTYGQDAVFEIDPQTAAINQAPVEPSWFMSYGGGLEWMPWAKLSGFMFYDQNANGVFDPDVDSRGSYSNINLQTLVDGKWQDVSTLTLIKDWNTGTWTWLVPPGRYKIQYINYGYLFTTQGVSVENGSVAPAGYGNGQDTILDVTGDVSNINIGVTSDEDGDGVPDAQDQPTHSVPQDASPEAQLSGRAAGNGCQSSGSSASFMFLSLAILLARRRR